MLGTMCEIFNMKINDRKHGLNVFNQREACCQWKLCSASSGNKLSEYSICQSEEYLEPMSGPHTKMHSMIVKN